MAEDSAEGHDEPRSREGHSSSTESVVEEPSSDSDFGDDDFGRSERDDDSPVRGPSSGTDEDLDKARLAGDRHTKDFGQSQIWQIGRSAAAGSQASYGLDVLVISAVQKEMQPLLDVFDAKARANSSDPAPSYDSRVLNAEGRDCKIRLMCLDDMGGRAASVGAQAISAWTPRYVIMVGIAAARPDVGIELGDLLIATDILDASHVKVDGSGPVVVTNFRDELLPCDRHLWRAMHDFALHRAKRSASPGVIVSSDTLVKDGAKRDEMLARHRRTIGLEMEGHGLANVIADVLINSRPAFGLVKAAVDWADEGKDDAYQAQGALSAAQFVRDFIAQTALPMAGASNDGSRNRVRSSGGGERAANVYPSRLEEALETLVLSDEGEQELAATAAHTIVAIAGPEGSGRTTLAYALLAARHGIDNVYWVANIETAVALTDDMTIEHNSGYLLEVNKKFEVNEGERFLIENSFRKAGSTLVIKYSEPNLVGTGVRSLPSINACGVGDAAYEALIRHVRFRAGSDDELRGAIELLNRQISEEGLSEARLRHMEAQTIADAAAGAVHAQQIGIEPDVSLFGDTGRQVWEKATSTLDRVDLLSHAAMGRMPIDIIAAAGDRLRRRLLPEEETKTLDLFGENRGSRNSRLGIHVSKVQVEVFGEEIDVEVASLGSESTATGLLQGVWADYPQVRGHLLNWLIDLINEGELDQQLCAAKAVGCLAKVDPARFLEDRVDQWARAEDLNLRWTVSHLVVELLHHNGTRRATEQMVEEWSKGEDVARRSTSATAAILAMLHMSWPIDPRLITRAVDDPEKEHHPRAIYISDAVVAVQVALSVGCLWSRLRPWGLTHVLRTLVSEAKAASRSTRRRLNFLLAVAIHFSETDQTFDSKKHDERPRYGDLHLARATDAALRAQIADTLGYLIATKRGARLASEVYRSWCWAALEHPSDRKLAFDIARMTWERADPEVRPLLEVEIRDVEKLSGKKFADPKNRPV